jgi:hypothetical protein
MKEKNSIKFDFGFGDVVVVKSAGDAEGKVVACFASPEEKKYLVEYGGIRNYFLASELEEVGAPKKPEAPQESTAPAAPTTENKAPEAPADVAGAGSTAPAADGSAN